MVSYIKNMSKDVVSVMTPYLTASDILKLSSTSTKFDEYYDKSWWTKNHQLINNIENHEDLQYITNIICKNIEEELFKKIIKTLLNICKHRRGETAKYEIVRIIFNAIKLNLSFLKKSIKFARVVLQKAIYFLSTSITKNISKDLIMWIIDNSGGEKYEEMICGELRNNISVIKINFNDENILKIMRFCVDRDSRGELDEIKTEDIYDLLFAIIDIHNNVKYQNISAVCKKIIDNMSFIEKNFDNKKNITLLYFYIRNHGIMI